MLVNGRVQSVNGSRMSVHAEIPEIKEIPASASRHEADKGIEGYEKIRVVGKGAFGLAVLYRCLADGELVVIKEVNIIELSASERQLALNEVQVLASLNHPNIISYRGSFERGGQLMIEMEYADGGNLNQLLARRVRPFSERAVLHIYRQICAALKHMHERGVLHRDLKTANVFLTKDYVVKVGDFGISKLLVSRAQAQTILGTPYYISPEMCEGKQYGSASDIWASGCILYEMICLEKAFEATNLPALVKKIIQCEFSPIPEMYSPELGQLVGNILQRDPALRPTAAAIVENRLPELVQKAEQAARLQGGARPGQPTFISLDLSHAAARADKYRSVLYLWRSHNPYQFDLMPISLPPRTKVIEVAVGEGHTLAVTADLLVYSWGEGSRGQLGHGTNESYIEHPEVIETLRGKSINKVCAGYEFSIFRSESGVIMSCGAGEGACLGHGDWSDCPRPRIIEKLLHVDIEEVACGSHHVLAISSKGNVFTWGVGYQGRLGLGHEQNRYEPEEITLPPATVTTGLRARAGPDCSAIITTTGDMIAWGSNLANKLSLNRKGVCGMLRGVDAVWLPSVVPFEFEVWDVNMGLRHSAILDTAGRVFVSGTDPAVPRSNKSNTPRLVHNVGDNVMTVLCGPDYTLAGTEDNVVYFWGVRHTPYYPSQDPTMQQNPHFSSELVIEPQEILALYGTESSSSTVPSLSLGGMLTAPAAQGPGALLLLLHTSAPVPSYPEGATPEGENLDTPHQLTTVKSAPTRLTIPDWLKAELAAASYSNNNNNNNNIMAMKQQAYNA